MNTHHAKKILEANLVNLAKKAQAGRVLTAGEIGLLEALADDGDDAITARIWAQSQVELAHCLNVTRQTIRNWLNRPGNPGVTSNGRYNVSAWKGWAKREGLRAGDGNDDPSQTRERARHVLLQNQKLEHQLGVLRREYVPMADVTQWSRELEAGIRKVVSRLHSIAPSVVGLPVADAEARLKEAEDEILQQLHDIELGA